MSVHMLSLYLQHKDINLTMLPTHVKETIDLLHLLVENYQRKQLQDTEYQKCGDLFLEVDDRTNLARRMRGAAHELTPESFLEQTGIFYKS